MPWEQEEDVDQDGVDQVLRRLGEQSPPAGMEARILGALRDRASVRRRPRVSLPALAAAVLLCGGAVGVFFAANQKRPVLPRTAGSHALSRAASAMSAQPVDSGEVPAFKSHPVHRYAVKTVGRQRAAALVPAYKAASFPAPPLPLTRQEQLLRLVAQHRNPVAFTQLNQRLQQVELARESKAFTAFFYQPTEEEYEKHAQQN